MLRPRPVLVAATLAFIAADPGTRLTGTAADRPSWAAPGDALTLVKEHRYRMNGRIRPLLAFWIGRDDVGGGTIAWKKGADGTVAYELLIGSDPALAPGGLNRWGYIVEEVHAGDSRVLGVMSKSTEASASEVRARLRDHPGGDQFDAILATVTSDRSSAVVSTVQTSERLTYHDLGTLLARLSTEPQQTKVRLATRPPQTRPGFLTSVAELMQGHQRPGATVAYIYNQNVYDLRLLSSEPIEIFRLGEERYTQVIRRSFETRERISGRRTRFELVYGLNGELAGVPIIIKYRPKWWLEVELQLEAVHPRETITAPETGRPAQASSPDRGPA